MFLLQEHDPGFLVFLQQEMRCGGQHAVDGGELAGDERRDLVEVGAAHLEHQVVSAGHQVQGGDLREIAQAAGDAVESALAFGAHAHLDDRLDGLFVEVVLVDDRMVAADDVLLFKVGDLGGDVLFGRAELFGEVRRGGLRIFDECVQDEFAVFEFHGVPPDCESVYTIHLQ